MIEHKPNKPPKMPIMAGRDSIGATCATAVVAPVNKPADPAPAIARPTIKAVDVGATPHISDPISKIDNAARKTILTL